ncbi:unnamed protein product [Ceutorhynchus assimilis]|uniref:BESS domain-containing protein n=1 Tax=Ceutorhynchus assimilis TaxID=467358 RepID=A0A9N9MV58_9CUCU|nr:unnamed protein product [Ceutorhynchus assimilis]
MKDDSDYQFLISLLPYLKKVPDHRKMVIRNKLQQVFIDEDEFHPKAARTPSTFTITSSPSASLITSDESSHQQKIGNYPNYTQEQFSFAIFPAQNQNSYNEITEDIIPTTETDSSFVR